MIGKFEFCQAVRGHNFLMQDIEAVCDELDVDLTQLLEVAGSMTTARHDDISHIQMTREKSYHAGVLDGLVIGIKAQIAEWLVLCEGCNEGVLRSDEHDPVPDDYDPRTVRLLCSACSLAARAALN